MSAERLPDFRERVSDAPQGVSREIDGKNLWELFIRKHLPRWTPACGGRLS